MTGFSQRLTQLRESKDLSKKQLAQVLHVSDSCISQYENGSSMPGYDTLLAISQYFNVSIDYLLGNTGKTNICPIDNEFCNNTTYHSFLTRCSKLSFSKRQALLSIVNAFLEE